MAAPLNNDDLTRVAAYLAAEERKKRGAPVPQQVLDRVYTNRPQGVEASTFSGTGFSKTQYGDDARGSPEEQGYRYLHQEDFDAMRSSWNPVSPPAGKLPFISNTPTHNAPRDIPTTPMQPAAAPPLADAMAKAATAARLHRGDEPQAPVAPPPSPAAKGSGASKRSREVSVSTTSTGAQPQARDFQPLAQLAPEQAEQRLAGLPEGVATLMRKRMGLEDAQADANRRALAVELASAGNQIGSGLAGGRYDDSVWAHQRKAAGQPLADYQARSAEERQQAEDQRKHDADERAIREAERAARMEEAKFQYGKERDKSQDALKQKGLEQEMEIAKMRSTDAQKDRWLRHQEILARAKEGAEARKAAADQKRKDVEQRQNEKDQAELAKREATAGETAADIRTLNDAIAKGREEGDIPGLGVWDSWKMNSQSLPAKAARAMFASPEDYAVSGAVNRLAGNENRAMTGLASSDSEREENKRRRGLDSGATEEAAVQGAQTLARDVKTRLKKTEAGYGEDVVNEYARRGAETSKDIPEPLSRRTGRTITRADGSVWAELDNGEAEQISPPRR